MTDFISSAPKSLQTVTAAMKVKDSCSLEEKLQEAKIAYKKAETSLCQQRLYIQNSDFSSSQVQMWNLDNKEGWMPKNWCIGLVVIKPVNPKGNKLWIFTGKTDSETAILWPCDVKSWLIEKTLMLGKIKDRKRREQSRMRWWTASSIQWTWIWANSGR